MSRTNRGTTSVGGPGAASLINQDKSTAAAANRTMQGSATVVNGINHGNVRQREDRNLAKVPLITLGQSVSVGVYGTKDQ